MKTIAFFGHRQVFDEQTIKSKLKSTLKTLIKQGYKKMLLGYHGDFDALVLQVCLDIKNNEDCDIEICIVQKSFSCLSRRKSDLSKADLFNLIGCETIFYDIEKVHYKNLITYSNKKMVDQCDLVICYVDLDYYGSGAIIPIKYAIKQNKPIINFYNKQKIEKYISKIKKAINN